MHWEKNHILASHPTEGGNRMSGFFGVASRKDCVEDRFFGTDYQSHLGTQRAGLAVPEP